VALKRNVVDFETDAILPRPDYPPKPVGVAITFEGKKKYYAWGHPDGNNCTKREAEKVLREVYRQAKEIPVVFHNAKFDMEVAHVHFGLPMLEQHQFEDTMILAFLHDPRDTTFALKLLARQYLGMDPLEQDAVRDWIIANVPHATEKNYGEHIAKAPGKLVGKYAIGDVDRTGKLFRYFYPYVKENDMLDAYRVEKELVPVVIDMEKKGVPIDVKLLQQDYDKAIAAREKLERSIRKKLGTGKLQGPALAKALEERNLVSEFELTEKGNKRTSRESLSKVCTDKHLASTLDKFGRYNKLISTYMEPWLLSACRNNGYFFPWFSSTPSDGRGGTKTGRFSSNFQQVPKEPEDKTLPFMRDYVIADSGQMLYDRDFSQQEIRILAHFENGELMDMYIADPDLDIHFVVGEIIKRISTKEYPRAHIKIVNFGVVYGSGAPSTAERVGCSIEEARELLNYHAQAIPGLARLKRGIKMIARKKEPIITIGGRVYYEEVPGPKGENKAYKLLNTLIQGSAADHTKQAMLRIKPVLDHYSGRFILTVHDEFLISAPKTPKVKIMTDIRDAMNFDLFKVPMLSDGKWGLSWGGLIKCRY